MSCPSAKRDQMRPALAIDGQFDVVGVRASRARCASARAPRASRWCARSARPERPRHPDGVRPSVRPAGLTRSRCGLGLDGPVTGFRARPRGSLRAGPHDRQDAAGPWAHGAQEPGSKLDAGCGPMSAVEARLSVKRADARAAGRDLLAHRDVGQPGLKERTGRFADLLGCRAGLVRLITARFSTIGRSSSSEVSATRP